MQIPSYELTGKVAIITGGGTGHLPLFLGYVGEGLLDGCGVGGVFQSPSAEQIFEISREVEAGAGILYLYGNYTGDIMNFAFVILKPLTLTLNKYVTLVEKMSDKTYMENNLRMEAWTFDSPNMAGEALKEFNRKCYVNNELIQNKMVVGDKKVDLKKITQPLLVCVAEKDHLVPPACSRPFMDAVGSKDKEYHEFPTGHIGMFTSSRSRKEIMPTIIEWMKARD